MVKGWVILQYYGPGPGLNEQKNNGVRSELGYTWHQLTNKTLRIRVPAQNSSWTWLKIFNSSGNWVYSNSDLTFNDRNELILSPLNLKSGIYFLQLISTSRKEPAVITTKLTAIK
uniref:T9SS type A sorting domain-containing protein n=1 Tax=candidate division WOR-3 bacterium TaxID=2052148 RepID=A0A7V3PTG0_UNCW3